MNTEETLRACRTQQSNLQLILANGCMDAHCIIRPKTGSMVTNGGCRCLRTMSWHAQEIVNAVKERTL